MGKYNEINKQLKALENLFSAYSSELGKSNFVLLEKLRADIADEYGKLTNTMKSILTPDERDVA